MLTCYNRGCGQTFEPEKNTEESCCHHPGLPFFHDAYKGWSCCNKKSVDFSEFLSIKGCTLSKHSNIKPPEPEKPAKTSNVDLDQDVVVVRAPVAVSLPRPPIETPLTRLSATVAPALKDTIDNLKSSNTSAKQGKQLAEGEVAVGTSCKNSGCTYSFKGNKEDFDQCQFHPGVPIFHEGLKYWSCCQKKTCDFSVFMAQQGCVYGQHKWLKENDDKKVVQCRYDWHQTGSNVIVSIYAKKYHYEESLIEINPIRLHVNLVFPEQENAKFDLDLELRGVIDVSKSSVQMYGSKVEITMAKAEPGLWPKLDFPRKDPMPASTEKYVPVNVASNSIDDSSDSEDDFNLDDIATVTNGVQLSELASTKHDYN